MAFTATNTPTARPSPAGKVGFRTSKGQAHFDNLLFTNNQTERSLYALGNQTIATRVSGDPTATNNGLFYIFSDHLGSTSVLAYINAQNQAQEVPGSRARYYPFGSPRTAPTQTITDRNFTGQKENLELGLIYYNARYYLPNLARFLTPDTLVPDPQNPQAFNRYTYVLNNPVRFTDPAGHCAQDDDDCWDYLEREFCDGIICSGVNGWRRWLIISDQSIWTIRELALLKDALSYVKNAFGKLGISNWEEVIGKDLRFSKSSDHSFSKNSVEATAYFWKNSLGSYGIVLSSSTFGNPQDPASKPLALFTILHEIGHAVDYQSGNNLRQFYNEVTNGYSGQPWYGSEAIKLTGEGYYFTQHGRVAAEGWADAFAAWVFATNRGSPPLLVAQSQYNSLYSSQVGTYYQAFASDVTQAKWGKIYDIAKQGLIAWFGN